MNDLILKQTFRIKEINPIYKETGWIFVTNYLTFSQAIILRSKLLINSIHDFKIIDCN